MYLEAEEPIFSMFCDNIMCQIQKGEKGVKHMILRFFRRGVHPFPENIQLNNGRSVNSSFELTSAIFITECPFN